MPCHETLHCHFAACAVLLWKRPGPTRVSIIDTLALRARDSREFQVYAGAFEYLRKGPAAVKVKFF